MIFKTEGKRGRHRFEGGKEGKRRENDCDGKQRKAFQIASMMIRGGGKP